MFYLFIHPSISIVYWPYRLLSQFTSLKAMAQPSSNTLGLLAKHYTRILSRWPKDPLRPDVQISSLLTARQAGLRKMTEKNASDEMRNVNALYSLLDDRYSKRVRLNLLVGAQM